MFHCYTFHKELLSQQTTKRKTPGKKSPGAQLLYINSFLRRYYPNQVWQAEYDQLSDALGYILSRIYGTPAV
jgi:hypothetical protein